jgi:hypothetical protein
MLSVQRLPIYAIGVFVLAGCQKASEPAPATAAATASDPAATPPEPPSGEARPSSEVSPTPAAGSASAAYPMCGGENQTDAASAPRSGPVSIQLAPAFLDQMAACKAEDGLPHDGLPTGEGTINAKGDCEFSNGVSCHYHSGSEFVSTSTSQQTPGQGELHCIVPSEEPKSPHVYGGHIVCRQRQQGEVHGHAPHDVHQGATCSAAIVSQIAPCQSFHCCDDGTLTGVISDLTRDGRNDIRPDFRICTDTLEVDCDLLANYTPHTANSPALGGVGNPVFAVAALHEPAKGKEHAAR